MTDDLLRWLLKRGPGRRAPDLIIGGEADPYLLRWHIIPQNRLCNVFLHRFLRSDDDRALHDHPWPNFSLLLANEYTEHRILAGGIHTKTTQRAGDWVLRAHGAIAHRIELHAGPCWTLFVTGPKYRDWGFHCPDRWVPWQDFTAVNDRGAIGKGCG